FGLFHWLLLVVCGWANASDAVEILCVSFLLPTARCDLLLSSSDMGLLTASIFLGMMVGGYMWGYLADQRGRRKVLVVSLTVNGLFGGLASMAPWFWLFLLLRFISGIGSGLVSDSKNLGTFLSGNIRLPELEAVCGAVLSSQHLLSRPLQAPHAREPKVPHGGTERADKQLRFSDGLTSLTLVPGLFQAGREKEAILVFRQMFDLNMKGIEKDFPVGQSAGSLLTPLVLCSYYGLWMWFPELFARVESSGGSPCANVSLPLIMSSLSVFLIYMVQTKAQSLGLSCIFSGVSVIAWNALDVVGTELYPTQLRSSALGFFTGVGRVAAIMGNVAFGKMVDSNCTVPILLVSALLLTGGLMALLLPQTRQTELT
ncbi:hypothetical protein GOODEAATRI_003739, partial [Goodea atripinnis]